MIQNARRAAISLLPPVTTLPPTMVMPPPQIAAKIASKDAEQQA